MYSIANHPQAGRERGFTLVELMIVLAIMAILLSLAVPSFNRTISDNRTQSAANTFGTAIAHARSEAVKRGRMVSLCPSSDQASCGGNWADGWLIYVEKTTVVPGAAPDIDTVLLVGDKFNKLAINRTAGTNSWVRFSPRGLAEESITLEVRPESCQTGYNFQEMVIGISGRATVTKRTC